MPWTWWKALDCSYLWHKWSLVMVELTPPRRFPSESGPFSHLSQRSLNGGSAHVAIYNDVWSGSHAINASGLWIDLKSEPYDLYGHYMLSKGTLKQFNLLLLKVKLTVLVLLLPFSFAELYLYTMGVHNYIAWCTLHSTFNCDALYSCWLFWEDDAFKSLNLKQIRCFPIWHVTVPRDL